MYHLTLEEDLVKEKQNTKNRKNLNNFSLNIIFGNNGEGQLSGLYYYFAAPESLI